MGHHLPDRPRTNPSLLRPSSHLPSVEGRDDKDVEATNQRKGCLAVDLVDEVSDPLSHPSLGAPHVCTTAAVRLLVGAGAEVVQGEEETDKASGVLLADVAGALRG